MLRSRPLRCLLAIAALALTAGAAATPASASTWPSAPTGARFVSATSSSFTVSLDRGTNVTAYVLWASTVKSDLYYDNLVTHNYRPTTLHYGISGSSTVTVHDLPYTTASYWYRLETRDGSNRRVSPYFFSTGLTPAVPTGLTPHSASAPTGTYLTWYTGNVTGYQVQEATNSSMTTSPSIFYIRGTTPQFTPMWLTENRRYYWRIRAVNHNVVSAWGSVVSAVPVTREQGVRVMTYNILGLGQDGVREIGGTIAPWSLRRTAAASLIKSVAPDVIGVQEAYEWVGGVARPGGRQVDSLCSALNYGGGSWVVARTEVPYPQSGWARFGDYIIYNSAHYQAVGAAGHWAIGTSQSAVYQELRNRVTGATFLFVTTHLPSSGGYSNDMVRENETRTMLQLGNALAARDHLPVVYSGDYNSNPQQTTVDGPGVTMRSALVADARLRAQFRTNELYDSFNNYSRTPYPYSFFLDYIWVSPGVSASSWGMGLSMSNGLMAGTIPSDHNPVHAYIRFPY